MPQVVGALLAGLILGPSMLDVLTETRFISQMSELGVIVILFTAGMGTNIKELKKSGKAGFLVALCGVALPLGFGALLTYLCAQAGLIENGGFLSYIFVGTVLTATSVSITVETLKELGKLNTMVGNTILAAALIDDVLGLIVLTIVSSFTGDNTNILLVLVKILLFFIFAIGVGVLATKFFNWMIASAQSRNLHRYSLLAFVLCLLMAYCAEEFFGVSDIIGAYVAGLVIASTPKSDYIQSKFDPLSYLLLTPIFFASIGIGAKLPDSGGPIIVFSLLLLFIAILSKLLGCGVGARLCHFKNRECIQIGIGMACRGEVALIVANKGVSIGAFSSQLMTPIIITVVGCAILTPVMLRLVFKKSETTTLTESELVTSCESVERMDMISEQYLKNGERE
ncbi:MAG: cation:proton antiporter [Intestinimonas sp.]|jgi:Kef-type K+ transport system membrane component KefB|nr:cation:proton antiporter [Intestinimonas sp.]